MFIVIFLSFALIGHISFGHLHPGFRDIYFMSLTCWDILMGDFDTYSLVAIGAQIEKRFRNIKIALSRVLTKFSKFVFEFRAVQKRVI